MYHQLEKSASDRDPFAVSPKPCPDLLLMSYRQCVCAERSGFVCIPDSEIQRKRLSGVRALDLNHTSLALPVFTYLGNADIASIDPGSQHLNAARIVYIHHPALLMMPERQGYAVTFLHSLI